MGDLDGISSTQIDVQAPSTHSFRDCKEKMLLLFLFKFKFDSILICIRTNKSVLSKAIPIFLVVQLTYSMYLLIFQDSVYVFARASACVCTCVCAYLRPYMYLCVYVCTCVEDACHEIERKFWLLFLTNNARTSHLTLLMLLFMQLMILQ